MSTVHFKAPPPPSDDGTDDETRSVSSSDDDDEEETWDDWVSDSMTPVGCKSLFDDKVLQKVEDTLQYDKDTHGFDLEKECKRLKLDVHGRIRFINFIRRTKPTPQIISYLTGAESFFSSDDFLRLALESDPMLQVQNDDWSDDEDEDEASTDLAHRIRALEHQLSQAKAGFEEYRTLIGEKLGIDRLATADDQTEEVPRDDDTHYFDSYGENDIHATMIQDKVRTSTYAKFILTNPTVFHDAIVLDVGCGTGILSLFAARAGAKHVYAVDASGIAERAEAIVKLNGLTDTITVIKGKVEEIEIPDKVDVIISEWMGYALLYESMLDSVLHARDQFLKPGGVMAPSQCQMVLGLCDASEILKDRVEFWEDVYGFDMTPMATGLYEEAIVDVVGPHTMLSQSCVVKDIHISTIQPRSLDFVSPFSLASTTDHMSKVTAFVLYFDTFFAPSGTPISATTGVAIVQEGDPVLAEVWPVGGKSAQRRRSQSQVKVGEEEKITSFSTGPSSIPTHWKQTVFLLKEPIVIEEDSVVEGNFHCRKSETNSRELDVEIHYTSPGTGQTTVQMYKVR